MILFLQAALLRLTNAAFDNAQHSPSAQSSSELMRIWSSIYFSYIPLLRHQRTCILLGSRHGTDFTLQRLF